ncbi:MAG: hypothetical protein Q7S18_01630 [bacterium]|nr:hypothetical protein [bacterium]
MFLEKSKIKSKGENITKRARAGLFRREFFRSALVHWVLIGTIFVGIANWVILAIYIRPIDLPIVLHYNVYLGVDIIGDWWQMYFLPIIADVFFAVNTFLAYAFYQKKERLAAYIFLLTSFFAQAGILIAIAGLVMINY